MIADDQDFFLTQVDQAMAGRMAGSPDYLQLAVANRHYVAVGEELVRLRDRTIHITAQPGRPHSFDWIFVDREAVALEENLRLGMLGDRPQRDHAGQPLKLRRMQQRRGIADVFDPRRRAEMVNMMMRA